MGRAFQENRQMEFHDNAVFLNRRAAAPLRARFMLTTNYIFKRRGCPPLRSNLNYENSDMLR
jgi:hypothetical protein